MAFRFDWEALISSPGVAGSVQERLQSIIDEVADTRPPFLGPIEVTNVGFGAVAPKVELLELTELEREAVPPPDDSPAPVLPRLCTKVFLQWDSDITIGIATELTAPFGMVGLPLEGTLRGIDFEGVFVVQIDPAAGMALCFFEGAEEEGPERGFLRDCGPLRSLSVQLAIGDETKLQDASKIELAISDHLSKEIRDRLVYPHGLKLKLPALR